MTVLWYYNVMVRLPQIRKTMNRKDSRLIVNLHTIGF